MRVRAALAPVALLLLACASDPAPAPSPASIEPPRIVSLYPTTDQDPPRPPPPEWIAASRAPEFRRCAACHNVERGASNGAGPNLYDVFGRPAATAQPNYTYSAPLRRSGLVWDHATLDRWLADPRALVPGSRMTMAGVGDPEKRKALIAFLRLRSTARP